MNKIIKNLVSVLLIFNFLSINILPSFAECCPTPCQPAQCCTPQCQPTQCCPTQPCQTPCCPTQCYTPQACCQPACAEPPSRIEHLPTYKGSSVNMVKISNCGAVILANNVLKVTFSGDFNSKKVCPNDKISFILNEGLSTVEGRCLLPCGTQIIGKIQQVENPKWMNRNAKVYLVFDEIVLPNCQRIPMCARVYAKDCALKASSWKAVGKAAGYTVGLFGIGAGLGAAIGTAGKASIGCMTYGMPIGGGVGLLVGTLTPGLHYKAKEGKTIYIQLVQDLVICCNG